MWGERVEQITAPYGEAHGVLSLAKGQRLQGCTHDEQSSAAQGEDHKELNPAQGRRLHGGNSWRADPGGPCGPAVGRGVGGRLAGLGRACLHRLAHVAGGQRLATWVFTLMESRSQRTVRVPAAAATTGNAGFSLLTLEFRPRSVVPMIELDPSHNDTRSLGLALFGLRRAG